MLTACIASSSPHPPAHHHRNKTKQNSSDPLGMFALLSLDLMLEIFYNLPVKSLMKLKCVCKPLNSIISDQKFAKDHLRLSHTRHHHLLICPYTFFTKRKWVFFLERKFFFFDSLLPNVLNNSTTTVPATNLNFPLNASGIRAVINDSCDGIICFETYNYKNKYGNMVVWNPCTRKFKILPPLENMSNSSIESSFKTGHISSIGCDPLTGDYKVVVVNCYQFHMSKFICKTQVRVLTLGTNIWRRISDFPSEIMGIPAELSYDSYSGKFVSGALNWVIRRDRDDYYSSVILSLDLGNESYQVISQPDYGLDERVDLFTLEVFRDCLCVFAHFETFFDIWVMKDYGNKDSWTKLFSIPYEQFPSGTPNLLYISEEDDQLLLDSRDEVFVYNYKNGTFKNPQIQGLPSTYLFMSYVYVESLISP